MLRKLLKPRFWRQETSEEQATQSGGGLGKGGRPRNHRYNIGSITLSLQPNEAQRHAVIGKSGSGKSYLTGVLMEETLENKGILCVIDPEGEHYTIKQRYDVVWIGGNSDHPFIDDDDYVPLTIHYMLTRRTSVVWDLSNMTTKQQQKAYTKIAEALFSLQQMQTPEERKRVTIVVDECQLFAPERVVTPEMQAVSENLAKRGRKFGIDSIWATQRPSSMDKDVLSQCEHLWLGCLTDVNDRKTCGTYLSGAGIKDDPLPTLAKGHFMYLNGSNAVPVQVRKRYCKHVS